MKIVNDTIERHGCLPGEKIKMKFDEKSTEFLMDTLSRLYADSRMAIVREYSTNALDATIAAGSTQPIEVSTPNAMNRYLIIRDFGIGMSADDIRNVYSLYGASTSRESNDFTGGFGIGSKSGFTYTNTFIVTSVKNSRKVVVSVSRSDSEGAEMQIVSDTETDEPSGTTIMIQTKRGDNFLKECERLFKYWAPGTVMVNGREPYKVSGTEIAPGIMMSKDGSYNLNPYDIIVMGGVPYPVRLSIPCMDRSRNYLCFICWVPVGWVNPTPNREQLKESDLTQNTLRNLENQIDSSIRKLVEDQIATQADYISAVNALHEIRQTYSLNPNIIKYKGKPLPDRLAFESGYSIVTYCPNITYNSLRTHIGYISLPIDPTKTIFVEGDVLSPNGALHSTRRKMLKDKFPNVETIFIGTNLRLKDCDIDIVKWNDIKSPVVRKQSNSYTIYEKSTGKKVVRGINFEKDNPIVWISSSFSNYTRVQQSLLTRYAAVVSIPAHREAKFCKDNPNIPRFKDHVIYLYQNAKDALKEQDIEHLRVKSSNIYFFFEGARLVFLDPELEKISNIAKAPTSPQLKYYLEIRELATKLGIGLSLDAKHDYWYYREYPLLEYSRSLPQSQVSELIQYTNLKYREKNQNV